MWLERYINDLDNMGTANLLHDQDFVFETLLHVGVLELGKIHDFDSHSLLGGQVLASVDLSLEE